MNRFSLPALPLLAILVLAFTTRLDAAAPLPAPLSLNAGWKLQDAVKVPAPAPSISRADYHPRGWHTAVVPGTVLTSLVADGVYPEPLYGENNRPDKIPESLCRTAYWYRPGVHRPGVLCRETRLAATSTASITAAEVWVNGHQAGTVRRGLRARPVRRDPVCDAGAGGGTRRKDTADAASRRPRGADHRGGRRQERRRDGAGRPDLPLHDRLGLDSRHPGPGHGACGRG